MRRRLALCLVLLAAMLGVGAAAATPAAAVPGLVKSVSVSGFNMLNKSHTALCPAATVVIGGGGYLLNVANGEVHIDQFQALPDGSGFRVTARQDQDGYAANWAVAAIAICAPAPAGLVYVSQTSVVADGFQSATVACPAGRRLLSTGARINNGQGQVVLDNAAPDAGLTTVNAAAYEDEDGYPNMWTVTALGVCANPPAGLALAFISTALDSATPKFASVGCPAGTFVHGGGFHTIDADGEATLHALDVSSSTALRVRVDEDQTGLAGNWRVLGFAICAA
jgi:hypothetical protein